MQSFSVPLFLFYRTASAQSTDLVLLVSFFYFILRNFIFHFLPSFSFLFFFFLPFIHTLQYWIITKLRHVRSYISLLRSSVHIFSFSHVSLLSWTTLNVTHWTMRCHSPPFVYPHRKFTVHHSLNRFIPSVTSSVLRLYEKRTRTFPRPEEGSWVQSWNRTIH